jgi:hypothetical protein
LSPVDREELRNLLSVSGTMAGLCITAVTLIATVGNTSVARSIVDEILVSCSVLFLLCTYCNFWALRTKKPHVSERLDHISETLFAIALAGMVSAGLLMVYALK